MHARGRQRWLQAIGEYTNRREYAMSVVVDGRSTAQDEEYTSLALAFSPAPEMEVQ